MQNKTYRLFISHSWNYSDAYDGIIDLLNKQDIAYYNHSVPKNDPIHTNGTDIQLAEKIESKVKGASCVLILAGVYSTYSKWINKEIQMAKKYNKPIVAIKPWASKKISSVVQDNATKIIGWNSLSILNAIKEVK
jgi:hypothetical protein